MMRMKPLAAALMVASVSLATQAAELSNEELRAQLAKQQEQISALQQQLEGLSAVLDKSASAATASPTHVGFYGEVHYNNFRKEDPTIGKSNFHTHRAVILLSHEFSEDVHFYSEVEFEGSPDTSEIETEVEQAFLDWRVQKNVSLNIGQFLLPVGLLNESHEPNVFYGVERNPVEEKIIPATWWEKGVMVRARPAQGFAVDVAVHNGLRGDVATLGGADGLREFRQEFGGSRAESMGYTVRAKYNGIAGLELAATVQHQDDINNRLASADKAAAWLWETHADWHWKQFGLRALATQWQINGDTAKANGTDKMVGWYVEPSWRVSEKIGVFARYNTWNTAANAMGKADDKQLNVGVNYWILPQVVLKADLQDTNQTNKAGDGFNLGLGLSF